VPLEVTSLYYDLFQRSMQEHMVDAESARPGHLSQVLSRAAMWGVCRGKYAFSDSDCILCAMQAALPLPLVQPRVDTIDAALLFVDMYVFS
jgi:hypothetical protein